MFAWLLAAVVTFSGSDLAVRTEPAEFAHELQEDRREGAIRVRAADAVRKGLRTVVFEGPKASAPELNGTCVAVEAEVSAPVGSKLKLWIVGNRLGNDGRAMFYAAPAGDFTVLAPRCKYRGAVQLDARATDWCLRLDLVRPDKGEVRVGALRTGPAAEIFDATRGLGNAVGAGKEDFYQPLMAAFSQVVSCEPMVRRADAAVTNEFEGGESRTAGMPEKGELVFELKLDRDCPTEKFAKVGEVTVKELNGVKYLEAGGRKNDRFAVGVDMRREKALYIVEIDYPDDAVRTMGVIVHGATRSDYAMGCGVACGGEYGTTGRMLTHRVPYWVREDGAAIAFMTERDGAPAAVSAIRVYEAKDGKLPVAKVREPPRVGGSRREIGIYFEDGSISWCFPNDARAKATDGGEAIVKRIAAVLRFTGLNTLSTPRVFYNGFIDYDAYNPREYPRGFFETVYRVFDAEGLTFRPTVNWDRWIMEDWELPKPSDLASGALNGSVFTIPESGIPVNRLWRLGYEPPQYCFAHPEVRWRISGALARVAEEGSGHPSFGGITIHLKYSSLLWFGTSNGPYNDYAVEMFEKASGLKVPDFTSDPVRGRARAEWIKANCWDAWLKWRSKLVTDFWIAEARKLAARCPGARLTLNNFSPVDAELKGFEAEDYIRRQMYEGGIDLARLKVEAPDIATVQTCIPADWRYGWNGKGYYKTEERALFQRSMHRRKCFWDFALAGNFPGVNIHDRYFEDKCGSDPVNLRRSWFDECRWRVGTINASAANAMEPIVAPFEFGDVQSVSKGGFLVGTYGMEDCLAPFAQAFRALPAVKFSDVKGKWPEHVKVRAAKAEGRTYVYAVNCTPKRQAVEIRFTNPVEDLVDGMRQEGTARIALEPYSLRSWGSL